MDPLIIAAITSPFAIAVAALWRFAVERFRTLEKSHKACEDRYLRLEARLDRIMMGKQ